MLKRDFGRSAVVGDLGYKAQAERRELCSKSRLLCPSMNIAAWVVGMCLKKLFPCVRTPSPAKTVKVSAWRSCFQFLPCRAMSQHRSIPFQDLATRVALHAKACAVRWTEAVSRNECSRRLIEPDFASSSRYSFLAVFPLLWPGFLRPKLHTRHRSPLQ